MKHKIAIVDDHVLIANALKSIISNFDEFEVLFLAENGRDFIEKLQAKIQKPELVILDVSMPVMDGFETADWITKNHPNIRIMALSMQNDDTSLIKMIKHGAKGYMLKNAQPEELEKAMKKIFETGHFFPDWAASKMMLSITDKLEKPKLRFDLTDREEVFLKFSATEMTYKEIAEKMCCSPRTIDNYRDSLFVKLDLKTRVGLAVFALKNGYVD